MRLNKDKPQEWAKTIVAFANKGGGKLYIGVADNGTAIGISQEEVDKEQRYLVDFIKNRITPIIDFEINYIHL
ncbi:helix-turn-helix domain-containing protein, partial [Candidatus Stoquefichus massiliensis]|uniref:AlbA family DNA-binding domain-containing protein n=1 Tax=Candidatus Stoquefichus massiliensis TaxID=1470350 RepID=UPI0005C9245A